VLFPGTATAASRLRWRALLFLLILPGALLYPCLSFRLFEPDEGRYAEIPREMLSRGEWVVPYLQGEPYLDKPPLLYWLVMGSYRVFGVHDWAARLIPALAVHGCVLLTYLLGRRSLGERAAFWGALALGLAPGFLSVGRLLVLDGLLALWVTLSSFAAFEALRGQRLRWGWWLVAAGASALGILTKGPVALVLLVPPLWAHRWLIGRSCRVTWPARLAFAAVLLAVTLPWYMAMCTRMPGFAGYFLWEHNVVRFMAPFDHQRPVWFYGPVVLAGLLPASLLLVPMGRFLLSGDPDTVRRRCPELGWVLLTAGWCVLFFSLSGCKLPTYVLPAFPPLALGLGYYLTESRWQRPRLLWAGSALMVVLLATAHYVVVPAYALYHSPLASPDAVADSCGDRDLPVVCYPRNCDSVAFYVGRDDLRSYRSKHTHLMVQFLQQQPRAVIVFTHRHALQGLHEALPPNLRLTGETSLGLPRASSANGFFTALRRLTGETREDLYYLAIVERR
jgi:4-amino-4-deoxy-L-arabinose transferase-like glycosyltransferase